jgi:hypothetical protein
LEELKKSGMPLALDSFCFCQLLAYLHSVS